MKQIKHLRISNIVAALIAIAGLVGLSIQHALSFELANDTADNTIASSDRDTGMSCQLTEDDLTSLMSSQSDSGEFFIGCGSVL